MRSGLASIVALALALPGTLAVHADEDQRPRPSLGSPDEAVRFDPLYFDLAASTGGDFYFWTPGEFARTTILPPMGDEDLVIAHGELGGGREIAIPVDGGLERLELFSGVQSRAEIELADPSGSLVDDGRTGVTLQRTRLMFLATISDPAPGVWTLRLRGGGLFSVSARASVDRGGEPVQLLGFEFVELGGRPGHEGYFERREAPKPGTTSPCRVRLEGAQGEIVVDYLNGDGSPMGLRAEMPAELAVSEDDERLLSCPVSSRPYRVRVTGKDAGGRAFQRVGAALWDPDAPPPLPR